MELGGTGCGAAEKGGCAGEASPKGTFKTILCISGTKRVWGRNIDIDKRYLTLQYRHTQIHISCILQ